MHLKSLNHFLNLIKNTAMTPSQKLLKKLGLKDQDAIVTQDMKPQEDSENARRSFLKKSALGGIALGGAFMFSPIEEVVARSTQKVSRYSSPSDLKITDMRYCVTTVLGRTAIIRIDTNQGIYGLGEVRDGGDPRYALFLKSRLLPRRSRVRCQERGTSSRWFR